MRHDNTISASATRNKQRSQDADRMPSPRKSLRKTRQPASADEAYTTRIIKASALLSDTKTLLSLWDVKRSVKENISRVRDKNLFGKASRSRVEDILAIFRQRYLEEPEITRALVVLAASRHSSTPLDRILYFHAAKSDRLLSDIVTETLGELRSQGTMTVSIHLIEQTLFAWVKDGRTAAPWSESTTRRVAQGILATLRDFGVLEGAANKRIGAAYLPVEAFAYIMFYLRQHQPSGVKLIDLTDWKLFFLSPTGVERFLFEAHQMELLEYHAAGSVTRLSFPATSLEEYANVIAQRAH
jgi:BrxA